MTIKEQTNNMSISESQWWMFDFRKNSHHFFHQVLQRPYSERWVVQPLDGSAAPVALRVQHLRLARRMSETAMGGDFGGDREVAKEPAEMIIGFYGDLLVIQLSRFRGPMCGLNRL